MANPTIEETLRRLEHRAAMLRHLAENTGGEQVAEEVLSGISDCCEDIVEMARDIRSALNPEPLAGEIKTRGARRQ